MDLAVRGCKGRSHSPCRYPCGDPHPALAIFDTEGVDIASARGRVLATDLVAKVNLPHWDIAAVDGFAVRGPDLVPDQIKRLTVIGEAEPATRLLAT